MPELATDIRIRELICDLLFIEDADFYPESMWEDFTDAISLFLNADEIDVVNYRYGNDDFCRLEVGERRRILAGLFARFIASRLSGEMDSVLAEYEDPSASAVEPVVAAAFDRGAKPGLNPGTFVRNCLEAQGLHFEPGTAGGLSFDSRIGETPVIVWRFSEYELTVPVLDDLLVRAQRAGFERLFLIAKAHLTRELPKEIPDRIPFTILPALGK